MKLYRLIMKNVFSFPGWTNKHYIGNETLISDIYFEKMSFDVILLNDKIFIFDSVSEFIDSQVFGGVLYVDDFKFTNNYTFINKEGDSWTYPEYKFIYWNYDEGMEDLLIQDKNDEWYSLGKKTNYKLVKQ